MIDPEDVQTQAVEVCYEMMRHYDKMAAEQYGRGREHDGNRYDTAAEAMREAAKRIGRIDLESAS